MQGKDARRKETCFLKNERVGLSADSQYLYNTCTWLGLGMRNVMIRIRGQEAVSCSKVGV